MSDKEVIYDVKDFVATITINRPKTLNAFTGDNDQGNGKTCCPGRPRPESRRDRAYRWPLRRRRRANWEKEKAARAVCRT